MRCTAIERDGRRCRSEKVVSTWYGFPVCKRHLRRPPRLYRQLGGMCWPLRVWPLALSCAGGAWWLHGGDEGRRVETSRESASVFLELYL